MSASTPALIHTWRVGKRYKCTITIPRVVPGSVACATVEWEPYIPSNLNSREMREYRQGRDEAVALLNRGNQVL